MGYHRQKARGRQKFNASSFGLSVGIMTIVAASAYMNVSGWIAMAETVEQVRVNAAMSSGFEMTALFAFPHAARVMGRGTYVKAISTLAIGIFAIGVNIWATQNFLFDQLDLAENVAERSELDLATLNAEIGDLEAERYGIFERYDGAPRDEGTVRDSYGNLDEGENPINMMRRDAEIGDRRRYDELTTEIGSLREARTAPALNANDPIRSVIPPEHVKGFVTALEVMKGIGLYVIGKNRIFFRPRYKPSAIGAHRR